MARRNQATAKAVEPTTETFQPAPIDEAAPQIAETAQPTAEQPAAQPPQREWRDNPYAIRTVSIGGYRVQLQESRPPKSADAGEERQPETESGEERRPKRKRWEMQIKFGNGTVADKPSDAILNDITSRTKRVTTKEGQEVEVQQFRWNDANRAWGMEIDFNDPGASRDEARRIFAEVVRMVEQERGVAASAGPGVAR